MFKRLIASLVCLTFSLSNLQYANAQPFSVNQLPVPGTMVGESLPFSPLALKGLIVNPQKPLEFQFIVDTGNSVVIPAKAGIQNQEQLKQQANQLVKYFLAGLTIPEGDLWVNLSPYEKNRMVPEALGQTDLGRDLLAQDYILKQLTASLIYPEKDLGKEFWSRVYAKAQQQFGTTNVPVNTFNKVWILPDQAQVFENVNSSTGSPQGAAYVTKSTLKVMLDEDYLALSHHVIPMTLTVIPAKAGIQNKNGLNTLGSQIVRQIILPEIEKEVNTGKNFAPLRQIYQALILAKWYKETIQNGLLDAVYTNKKKVAGVNLADPAVKEQIYERYLKAYKKGAFNYIKEDPTPDGQFMPRKYFSGGITRLEPEHLDRSGSLGMVTADGAMLDLTVDLAQSSKPDAAMAKTNGSNPLLKNSIDELKAALNDEGAFFIRPEGGVVIVDDENYGPMAKTLDILEANERNPNLEISIEAQRISKAIGERLGHGETPNAEFIKNKLLVLSNLLQLFNSTKIHWGGKEFKLMAEKGDLNLLGQLRIGLQEILPDGVRDSELLAESPDYIIAYLKFENGEIKVSMTDMNWFMFKPFKGFNQGHLDELKDKIAELLRNHTSYNVTINPAMSIPLTFNMKIIRDSLLLNSFEIHPITDQNVGHRLGYGKAGSITFIVTNQELDEGLWKSALFQTSHKGFYAWRSILSDGPNKDLPFVQIAYDTDADRDEAIRIIADYVSKAMTVEKGPEAKEKANAAMITEFDRRVVRGMGQAYYEHYGNISQFREHISQTLPAITGQALFMKRMEPEEITRLKPHFVFFNGWDAAGKQVTFGDGVFDELLARFKNVGLFAFYLEFEHRTAYVLIGGLGILILGRLSDTLENLGINPAMSTPTAQNKPDAAMILSGTDDVPILNNTTIYVNGERYSLFEYLMIRNEYRGLKEAADENQVIKRIFANFIKIVPRSSDSLKIKNNDMLLANLRLNGLIHKDSDTLSSRYRKLINLSFYSQGETGNFEPREFFIDLPGMSNESVDKFAVNLGFLGKLYLKDPKLFNILMEHSLSLKPIPENLRNQLESFVDEHGVVLERVRKYIQFIVRKVTFKQREDQEPQVMNLDEFEAYYRQIEDKFNTTHDSALEKELADQIITINQSLKYVLISKIEGDLTINAAMASKRTDHFDITGRTTGHSVEDDNGNIRHYDSTGLPKSGYSKRASDGRIIHYDIAGHIKGSSKDKSQLTGTPTNGGIDLNQINVLRKGKTVNVQFDPAQLNRLQQGGFEGFTPVIISMTPIKNPLPLLGIGPAKHEELLAKV